MTTDEVLRSYSSVKGHRTRVEREIESFLKLLNAQYSSTTELRVNDRLKKLEKHSYELLDISEFMISIKYPKARDHAEEVKEFMDTLQECSDQVFKILHERHAAAGPAAMAQLGAAPPPAPRPNLKPSASELKPTVLTHDSSTSVFWSWKKRFRAYYDASGINHLPCLQQQAYFCLLYTSPSPRDRQKSRMPSSA